jgi:BON domain
MWCFRKLLRLISVKRKLGGAHKVTARVFFFEFPTEIDTMKFLRSTSIVIATAALATLLGCASTPTREGTGEYIDDTVITTKVKAAIFAEPTLKSTEINVETFKGVVQLSGFVSSEADTQKAVEVTRKIKGVESVKNDMRVKGR